jgi:hypothetical protein
MVCALTPLPLPLSVSVNRFTRMFNASIPKDEHPLDPLLDDPNPNNGIKSLVWCVDPVGVDRKESIETKDDRFESDRDRKCNPNPN